MREREGGPYKQTAPSTTPQPAASAPDSCPAQDAGSQRRAPGSGRMVQLLFPDSGLPLSWGWGLPAPRRELTRCPHFAPGPCSPTKARGSFPHPVQGRRHRSLAPRRPRPLTTPRTVGEERGPPRWVPSVPGRRRSDCDVSVCTARRRPAVVPVKRLARVPFGRAERGRAGYLEHPCSGARPGPPSSAQRGPAELAGGQRGATLPVPARAANTATPRPAPHPRPRRVRPARTRGLVRPTAPSRGPAPQTAPQTSAFPRPGAPCVPHQVCTAPGPPTSKGPLAPSAPAAPSASPPSPRLSSLGSPDPPGTPGTPRTAAASRSARAPAPL